MRLRLKLSYLLIFMLFSIPQASNGEISFSIAGGLSRSTYEDTSLRSAYGGIARYVFKNNFSLGGVTLSSPNVEDFGKFNYVTTGVDVAYRLQKLSKTSFLGFRLGLAEVSWQPNTQALNFTPFFWQIYVDYTWPIWDWLEYGFEFGYTHIDGDGLVIPPNQPFELDNFSTINLLFLISIWV